MKPRPPPEVELSENETRALERRDLDRRLGIDPLDRLTPEERQRRKQREELLALLEGYAEGLRD